MRMKLISHGQIVVDFLENLGRRDSYKAKFDALCKAVDNAPEIACVPIAEYEKLEQRVRELEKRLSDVSTSPFDGGMSQAEYFKGETDCKRRERWVLVPMDTTFALVGGVRYRWKCTGCGAGIETEELRPPAEHRCYICGACMDWGASDG